MKALVFEQTGKPADVLQVKEIDKPSPKEGEVLVKVLRSPINPADTFFIQGTYRYKPGFPQAGGMEGCGIIESIGDNITIEKDKLAAFFTLKAWAEYVVVPQNALFVLPGDFAIDKAAQFCLNPFTAYGLLQDAHVKQGDWLLLTAGSSSVARIVTQLAKLKGIKVLLAIRNMKYADELKTSGAQEVIDITNNEWTKQVMQITAGKGVNAVLDVIGGDIGTALFDLVSVNGHIVIYGLMSPGKIVFHNSQVIYKQLTVKGFGVRNFVDNMSKEEHRQMIDELISALGNKNFGLPVFATFEPGNYKQAFEAADQHAGEGKTLFVFNN
jgi:NADPH:quinone reductase